MARCPTSTTTRSPSPPSASGSPRGLADYVPEDVPPATDPLPDGASEEADLAQRGLVEETPADDGSP